MTIRDAAQYKEYTKLAGSAAKVKRQGAAGFKRLLLEG
jgi:hypothetical protein